MDEISDRATVEDLPDEVLENVFTFLSPKGVKIAALVNKR